MLTKKIGLILRTFATEEEIAKRVKMVEETVNQAASIVIDGKKIISQIDVLVWADKRFPESDCGKTAPALREAFFNQPFIQISGVTHVQITEVSHGDLYCGLLNLGVTKQLRDGIDYSIILSPDARSYLTTETIRKMVKAIFEEAKAVGVAIYELTQSILEGRLANTFCLWDNIALLTVGGFDLRAAKPVNNDLAFFMQGWSPEINDVVHYPLAGVEEVIPLARLVETFGPCLATILPEQGGYEVPDPEKEPECWKRHISKLGTKLERQTALLAQIGKDPSYLKGGVMEKYRTF